MRSLLDIRPSIVRKRFSRVSSFFACITQNIVS